jgi:hypothetical protein
MCADVPRSDTPELPSATSNAIRSLELKVSEGLKPNCPVCASALVIGNREEGTSGSVGYQYRCSRSECSLRPGFAYQPWYAVLVRALQQKAVQLGIAALGTVTIAGIVAFSSGVIRMPGTPLKGVSEELQSLADKSTNEFERGEYLEILRRYKQMSSEQRLDFTFGKSNVFAMAEAMDDAKVKVEAINAYPVEAWNKELTPYLLANKRAIQRGVKIQRIFLIPNSLTEANIPGFLGLMQFHKDLGIDVHYAFEDEITLLPYFVHNPFYPCALFDGKFFGFDVRTNQLTSSFPDTSRFTWDKDEIALKSPFPAIWDSSYVHRFDGDAQATVLTYVRSHHN